MIDRQLADLFGAKKIRLPYQDFVGPSLLHPDHLCQPPDLANRLAFAVAARLITCLLRAIR